MNFARGHGRFESLGHGVNITYDKSEPKEPEADNAGKEVEDGNNIADEVPAELSDETYEEACEAILAATGKKPQPRKGKGKGKGNGGFGNRAATPPKDRSNLRCGNCGAKGHLPKNCRKEYTPLDKRNCFECGQPGHQAANCPAKDKSRAAHMVEQPKGSPAERNTTYALCMRVEDDGYQQVKSRSGRDPVTFAGLPVTIKQTQGERTRMARNRFKALEKETEEDDNSPTDPQGSGRESATSTDEPAAGYVPTPIAQMPPPGRRNSCSKAGLPRTPPGSHQPLVARTAGACGHANAVPVPVSKFPVDVCKADHQVSKAAVKVLKKGERFSSAHPDRLEPDVEVCDFDVSRSGNVESVKMCMQESLGTGSSVSCAEQTPESRSGQARESKQASPSRDGMQAQQSLEHARVRIVGEWQRLYDPLRAGGRVLPDPVSRAQHGQPEVDPRAGVLHGVLRGALRPGREDLPHAEGRPRGADDPQACPGAD